MKQEIEYEKNDPSLEQNSRRYNVSKKKIMQKKYAIAYVLQWLHE